jgi:hypothetical protein
MPARERGGERERERGGWWCSSVLSFFMHCSDSLLSLPSLSLSLSLGVLTNACMQGLVEDHYTPLLDRQLRLALKQTGTKAGKKKGAAAAATGDWGWLRIHEHEVLRSIEYSPPSSIVASMNG